MTQKLFQQYRRCCGIDVHKEQVTVCVLPADGQQWRINFSRVEWLHDVVDGRYVKRPETKEDNWVWTPQHVVNMHVPREWGFVEFVAGPK